MHYEFYNQLWDFDDDVELYFLHERILEDAYLRIIKAPKTEQRTDKATREFIRGMKQVWTKRAETGSNEWARPVVHNYDDSMFERVSDDYTMCCVCRCVSISMVCQCAGDSSTISPPPLLGGREVPGQGAGDQPSPQD